jgi:hypothetical protein
MAQWPKLWFVSRTPTILGQTVCRMARFYAYHAGEHGTGWRRIAQSVPLATGGAVHVGVELLCGWIKEYQSSHGGQPPESLAKHADVIAWAASEAAARYEIGARAKGFLERGLEGVGDLHGLSASIGVDTSLTHRVGDYMGQPRGLEGIGDDGSVDLVSVARTAVPVGVAERAPVRVLPPAVETLILEQRTLIEAQVWVFATLLLPQILGESRILDVEHEESVVLDCSCGLGDGVADWVVHDQRKCTGIVQMGRADLLCEGWAGHVRGQITYLEVKTKATPNLPWEKAWEHSGQLRVNMETASRRLGKRVEAAYIPVLFKGWRGRDRDAQPDEGKRQHSPLVYGYYDAGSPGFGAPEWRAAYKWVDDYGKGHTLPKTYRSKAIWDETIRLPARAFARAGASRVEIWVTNYLTPEQWPTLAKLLGPFPHQVGLMPETLASVLAEEREWRAVVDNIRGEVGEGRKEDDAATEYISRSWQCSSFSGEPCAFQPLCFKHPGWEDPAAMGIYSVRTPHHQTERAAYEAIGLEFPADETEDEGEVME